MSIELTTENLALKARVQGLEQKLDALLAENERLRTTRPEPSRFEIAAEILQSMVRAGNVGGVQLTFAQCAEVLGVDKYDNSKYPQICAIFAFKFADALIAAAKGGE